MDNSWDNYEPAPFEYFHSQIMEEWHNVRKSLVGDDTSLVVNGIDISNIVAAAKRKTYDKYKHLNLDKAIPKNQFPRNEK